MGAGASDGDADDLPDPELDSDPEPDEDWASYRGAAGHARYVEEGDEFDADSLEAAWSVERESRATVAVADDTVYATTDDGVLALEVDDGSVVWENEDVDATDPAVVGKTVYLSGDEVVALDTEDGSVRWETEFEPEDWTSRHTVAYDGVYVVADGTMYALEADDGSIRWEQESVAITIDDQEEEYEFLTATAAANGVVYAGTVVGPLALEPETGDVVWRVDRGITYMDTPGKQVHATTSAVVVSEHTNVEQGLYDAHTGDDLGLVSSETVHETALDEDVYVDGTDMEFYGSSIEGDEYDWSVSSGYVPGQPVIGGDTVYAYFDGDAAEWADYSGELVAFDKYDGSEKWTLSEEDAPVGLVHAISDGTLYVHHEGELVALREPTDEDDEKDPDDGDGDEDDEKDQGDDEKPKDGEDDETESDCPDEDFDCPGDDESADGDDGDESDDDDDGADDDGTDDDADDIGDDDNGLEDDDGPEDDAENETSDDADSDDMPGFTTGAGIVGGAATLEWLRRRADVDDEPAE